MLTTPDGHTTDNTPKLYSNMWSTGIPIVEAQIPSQSSCEVIEIEFLRQGFLLVFMPLIHRSAIVHERDKQTNDRPTNNVTSRSIAIRASHYSELGV